MGFHPIPHYFMAGRRGAGVFAFPSFGCGRSRAGLKHGAKPHTPLLGRGKCEKAALSGAYILCEHALTGKMTVGIV